MLIVKSQSGKHLLIIFKNPDNKTKQKNQNNTAENPRKMRLCKSDGYCLMNEFIVGGYRRSVWNGRVEIVHVSSGQAVIKSIGEQGTPLFSPVVIRTQPGLEIESVRLLLLKSTCVVRFYCIALCLTKLINSSRLLLST